MRQGEVIGGRFELEGRVGAGGMGEVYRARDLASGEVVAVKVLLGKLGAASGAARFKREAEVLAELHHPGIVRYVAHGTAAAGEPYLAMEWLDGEDLSSRLEREGLTVDETVALGRRVAEALGAVHGRGVVHRDLKPSNLFLVERDITQVKLLDFGITKLRGATQMTRTGVLVGTPGYMAPEQARSGGETDARADVFALGCVLFQCLTGRPAFVGEHIMAILAKVLLDEAPRVRELRPEVPLTLDALCARMLAKDPEERPRDGTAVAEALAALDMTAVLPGGAVLGASGERASGLTQKERRVLSVILIGRGPLPGSAEATLDEAEAAAREALCRTAEACSSRVEFLADGSVAVTVSGAKVATDQAALAARCALGLRRHAQGFAMALATGRGELTGRMPLGDAIDRATAMLATRTPSTAADAPIAIDELTAGLLDARFEVREGEEGLSLWGERELAERARTLLGKPTACVGRDWELGTLEQLFTECVDDPRARAVLVTAPAGMGKSRLAYEFLSWVRRRGDETAIWLGRGDTLRAGSTFGLLGQALRGALGIVEGEPLEARRERLEARVAAQVAPSERRRVAVFLGELVGTPFPEEESPPLRAARREAQLMNEQMRRAWEDFLAAESAAHPVLLVLEDLHWGDLPTVRFIDGALRKLKEERPILVLALGRPEVHELFPRLWAAPGVQEIRLKELSRKASARLVRQVLGERVSAAMVERLVAQAEGNAFYLEELIRAVAEGRGEALPETVLAMVEARLLGLTPEARRVLRAASVFGEAFWPRGIAALLGEAGSTFVGSAFAALAEQEVIQRLAESRFPGEEEFTFRHALLRESAYAMLSEGDRALGHKLAGAWIEQAGEGDAMVLAEHFERGGEPLRSVGFYRSAAEQALRGEDCSAAIDRAERGIRCGAEGDDYTALVLLLAEALAHNGDDARSLMRADEVLTLARPGSRFWSRALARKLNVTYNIGVPRLMMEAIGAIQGVEPEPEAAATFACSLTIISWTLLSIGQFELSETCAARIERLGESLMAQDPLLRGWIEGARALSSRFQGDAWAALTRYKRAEASFAEAGDRLWRTAARLNEGLCFIMLGVHVQGQQILVELIEGGESTPSAVSKIRTLLALAKAERGALDEALADATVLAAAALACEQQGQLGSLRLLLAQIQLRRRDLESAEREALLAVDIVPSPRDRALALATLADIQIAQRRPGEALESVERALAAQQAVPPAYRAGAYLPLMHAEALDATGDHEGARAVLTAARRDLLARADKIGDPAMRESFLSSVPENARLLSRAREWLGEPAAARA